MHVHMQRSLPQISNNFTAGLWTFRFNRSLNNHTYTTLNVTSPLNVTEMYKARGPPRPGLRGLGAIASARARVRARG